MKKTAFLASEFATNKRYSRLCPDRSTSGLLEAYIDVGEGNSIFIRTAEGYTILIDGGEGNGLARSYFLMIKTLGDNISGYTGMPGS